MRGARCRSVARQVIAILPEFTPVPTCTGSSCTAGGAGVDLDPALGRIARRGGLIAEPRRRPRHQADPVRPLAAEVDVDGRGPVRVVAAADPGAAAVLGDPELDRGGPVGARVIHGVLELEPRAVDQERVRRAGPARCGRGGRRGRLSGGRSGRGSGRASPRMTPRGWPPGRGPTPDRRGGERSAEAGAAGGRPGSRSQSGGDGRARPFAPMLDAASRGCAVRCEAARAGADAGRLGGGSSSTGVKPWPAVIRDGAGPGPVPEIGSMIGGPVSSDESETASGGLPVPSGRLSTASVTLPARSATDIFTRSASTVPASQVREPISFGRAIGTRFQTPTPSTWYSSASDRMIQVLVLHLPTHRGHAPPPTVRLEHQRRRHRVDDHLHLRLDGRIQARRDLAVGRHASGP